jgi:hypothetical protein
VYCLERKFLRAEDYPNGMEIDEFDAVPLTSARSIRTASSPARRASCAERAGPADLRALRDLPATRPSSRRRTRGLVEVGRAVGEPQLSAAVSDRPSCGAPAAGRREPALPASIAAAGTTYFLTLLKGMYQAAKRAGATHWLAATEKPLQRMLAQRGFPFHQIGPDSDYFGIVAPYQMDLQLRSVVGVTRLTIPAARPEPGRTRRCAATCCPGGDGRAARPMSPNQPLFGAETRGARAERVPSRGGRSARLPTLLEEHGVRAGDVHDLASFVAAARCCRRATPSIASGSTR